MHDNEYSPSPLTPSWILVLLWATFLFCFREHSQIHLVDFPPPPHTFFAWDIFFGKVSTTTPPSNDPEPRPMAELDPAVVESMIAENGLNEVTLKVGVCFHV